MLLDANVLVPQRLSSLLLTLAENDLFQPRWSEQILNEVERTLVNKLSIEPARASRRLEAMQRAFPRATVTGHESVIGDPRCDIKDQHVYAAAQCARAGILVTFNLRDFPTVADRKGDVPIQHPDHFLLQLWSEEPRDVESAITRESERMTRPPMAVRDILAGIAPIAPLTANTLHNHWGQRSADFPAFVAADPHQSPYAKALNKPDFSKPDHVLYMWWTALGDRKTRTGAQEVLEALTYSPAAFDYAEIDEMLSSSSLAANVYYAVDAPDEVAYMRFVPRVAQTSQSFAPVAVMNAVFITLVRVGPEQWKVWGLGDHMASLREISG